ncbi:MAG: GumC family protein [Alphaproteobacteria bacterium]
MAFSAKSTLNLGELGKILFKRRWTIITFFLVVSVLITIATLLQTPVYRATAVVRIETEAPNIVGFKEVVALGLQNYWASKEYYETQFRIIRSRPVAAKVIERLHLTEQASFASANNPEELLTKMIRIEPIKSSQLVAVSIEYTDPEMAAEICNTLSAIYQEQNLTRKIDASQEALDWLAEEQGDRDQRVRDAEKKLQEFLQEHNIFSFEERQNIVSQEVQDLSDALTQAKRSRIASQSAYETALKFQKAGKALMIPEVIENTLIQELKEELVRVQKEKSKLAKKWKPQHPGFVKIENQIQELTKRINEEVEVIVGGLEATYQQDRSRERMLVRELQRAKTEALRLAELEIEYRTMKREAQAEGVLFDELQKRQKETEVTTSLPLNNISVVEPALVPKTPIRPRKRVNVLLGALLGLLGGVGLAFFLEYMDTTIKTGDDLEETINSPFLGIIPSFTSDEETTPDELFTYRNPKSSITESCRSIRTNIVFSSAGKALRRLLVTSAGPQEGKSTAVINLGIIFAQGGKRVLMVDSDLRRPRLHRAFQVSRKHGLTDLIMGEASIDDVIVSTEVPGVDLIPCGPIPPNPSELLGTERMNQISEELSQRYDLLLFDSPPVVAVTDAVVMSKVADGVVLIAKAGKTTREILLKAARQLDDVEANILGTVLNDFNIRDAGYRYYYYYYHYRSRENEGEGGEADKVVRKRKRRHRA